jgi:pimeloyl-ACP methyl ester carboxylesterase
MHAIHFDSQGCRLAGQLWLPDSSNPPRSPVAVLGSWTTVKEQMASRYARELATLGHPALAFDVRGCGESEGLPRDWERPVAKAEDLAAALAWLTARFAQPAVALGICAGGGYAVQAAINDAPMTALTLVAPWLHDAALVEAVYGGAAGVAERLRIGETALARYRQTGVVDYVPAVSASDPRAAMYGPYDYYLDPQRGAIPAWRNRFAVAAWLDWLRFDPLRLAPSLTTPTLIVHGEQAALPGAVRRFAADAATAVRGVEWLDGNQFDFYDRDDVVASAARLASAHFRGLAS